MELVLTDEQQLIRETTGRFITDMCPLDVVRRLAETTSRPEAEYAEIAAEIGWFSMLVPEQRGGGSVSGEGLRDLAIVAEERGRTLQPGPFIGSNVVAQMLGGHELDADGSRALEELLLGTASAAWVMGADSWSPGVGVTATRERDGYRLVGEVRMVQDALQARWLLITAQEGDGVSQFLVSPDRDRLTVRSLESLDITQRFGAVTLADVLVPHAALLGEPGTAGVEVERAFQTALVLVLAETVGAAAALLSLTTEYAKDRTAFGRPIGSFQALKHQLADLALALEATKAIAVQATRAAQAQSADCSSMVSIAKVWAGEAAIDIAQGCLQVFGGIGYTWEHDLHLYLRRLTMSSQLYGGPRWHRDRIWAMQAAQPDTTDLS